MCTVCRDTSQREVTSTTECPSAITASTAWYRCSTTLNSLSTEGERQACPGGVTHLPDHRQRCSGATPGAFNRLSQRAEWVTTSLVIYEEALMTAHPTMEQGPLARRLHAKGMSLRRSGGRWIARTR